MITTSIDKAKEALDANGIIALPTETVYGLAGNAYNEEAVQLVFELKQRPFYNPLIVHIKSINFLEKVARDIPPLAIKLAEKFWPGSLTLVLKKQDQIPDLVTAGKATVAVRVPNHPMALELLSQLDYPLAAPSANPFGSISPTSAAHVAGYFQNAFDVILDGGECIHGLESTIIGFEDGEAVLYRHGSISLEEIEAAIGKIQLRTKSENAPAAPGMLSRHYAPQTPIYLTDDVPASINLFTSKKIGLLLFKNEIVCNENMIVELLSKQGDLAEAAKNLYAALHRLDHAKLDILIAEKLPATGLGNTINDRLLRATKSE